MMRFSKLIFLFLLCSVTSCASKAPYRVTKEKHFIDTWAGGFSTLIVGSPTFTSDGENLYFGTRRGTLYVLSGKNGSIQFKKKFNGGIEATPLVTDQMVIVGTAKGEFVAIDKKKKNVVWSQQFNGEVIGKPTLTGNYLLAGTNEGFLYALDPATGELKWRFKKEPPDRITLKGFAAPARKSGNILVAFADGSLSGLREKDGTELWSMKLPTATRFGDVVSPIINAQNQFLVAQYGGATFSLDEAGQIRWSQPDSGSMANISIQDQVAYLPGNENQIKAVMLSSGQSIWTAHLPETATLSGTVIWKDRLIAGSFEGKLYVVNRSSGVLEWTYDVGAPVQGPPQVVGSNLWVLTEKGKLFRFN